MSPDLENEEPQPKVRSLRELLDLVTGRNILPGTPQEDSGVAESLPFPFLALVGQYDMKLALLLSVINPGCGGVLLVGPRGTGKTTAVRSLLDLLPLVHHSTCFYGCTAEDIETGGIDAVCPDCVKKFGQGLALSREEPSRLVELPLNARLEDVIGGIDERALVHERMRLKRGILAQADLNILYADEVNLLSNEVIDAILDAASQGTYTVRRGPNSATYRSRFTLIGSMNPEEGVLRPQILDRFGLRVVVHGLENPDQRWLAYQRVQLYRANPRQMINAYFEETEQARAEIQASRSRLGQVTISKTAFQAAIALIRRLQIDSLRAEITLFEAARAFTASDGRSEVELSDIRVVAPMALRLRRSAFMTQYFSDRHEEEQELFTSLDQLFPEY